MPLLVNLRRLELESLELSGFLDAAELASDLTDELVELREPLAYTIEVERLDHALMVQGRLDWTLTCACARCLKSFRQTMTLERWAVHVPLTGEEAAPIHNDCVDLTPYLREDIVLALPQHPLCEPECRGLLSTPPGQVPKPGPTHPQEGKASVWADLDKLKL